MPRARARQPNPLAAVAERHFAAICTALAAISPVRRCRLRRRRSAEAARARDSCDHFFARRESDITRVIARGVGMYKRILVPVDGSPASSWALGEAINLGRDQGSEMLLIHIVDDWKVATGDIATVNLEAGSRRLRQAGQALLREAERASSPGRRAGHPRPARGVGTYQRAPASCNARENVKLISSYAERTGAVACAGCFWAATQNTSWRHTPGPIFLPRASEAAHCLARHAARRSSSSTRAMIRARI